MKKELCGRIIVTFQDVHKKEKRLPDKGETKGMKGLKMCMS